MDHTEIELVYSDSSYWPPGYEYRVTSTHAVRYPDVMGPPHRYYLKDRASADYWYLHMAAEAVTSKYKIEVSLSQLSSPNDFLKKELVG